MTTKSMRKIVKIDESKCNGCGLCVPSCAEGALKIIEGKARLVSEVYCDGLGACLGECPQGAISIEERPSQAFDEHKAKEHLNLPSGPALPCGCPSTSVTEIERHEEPQVCGCPSQTVVGLERPARAQAHQKQESMLGQWPVQMRLVPPSAPFLKNADVVLIADCVPFAYRELHHDFLQGNAVLVACPKLDDVQAHFEKLVSILETADIKSLTVVRMEVPCCGGLVHLAKQAISASGKKEVPFREVVIGIKGNRI
jgi:NAD-dependent dihydropyrimidine dehydrogenase PreA subunit